MKELLERLFAINATAKNCHYDFEKYGDHLLSDIDYLTRINQIDEINEVCFLGLGEEALNQKDVMEGSLRFIPDRLEDEDKNISSLKKLVKDTLVYIQKMDLKVVGVANLVGAISQDLLKFHGLLFRAGILDEFDNEFLNKKIENEDKWITVKPNGENNKGRPLLVKDGETPKEAIDRKFGTKVSKKKSIEDIKKELDGMSRLVASKRQMVKDFGNNKKSMEFLERGKAINNIRDSLYFDEIKDVEKANSLFEDYKEKLKELKEEMEEVKKSKDKKQPDGTVAGYNVKRETSKAYLLTDNVKEFWVQKRWIKDNKLNPSAEKAYKESMTIEEKKIAKEELDKIREEGYPIPKNPAYESEKAFGFDFMLDFYDIEKDWKHRMFIPKSVIQKNGNIPTWIIEKKMEEMKDKYRNYGGFYIEKNPFIEDDGDNDSLKNSQDKCLYSSILGGEVVFNECSGLNDASEDYLEEENDIIDNGD